MAEITISLSDLENTISTLQILQSACSANDTTSPTTDGGGSTINELELLAQLYKDLNSNMATLISNTVSFLNNVKESYQTSDQKSASRIQGS